MFLFISILPFVTSYCPDKTLLYCDTCSAGKCTHCVQGYSVDTDPNSKTHGQCLPCQMPNCLKCYESSNMCQMCKEGTYLVTDPQNKFYGKCLACSPGCKHCNSPDSCERCIHGYGLNEENNCVKCQLENCTKCGADYKFCEDCSASSGLSALNGGCTKCQVDNCVSCNTNNARVCNKCEGKYFINAGLCEHCADPHCANCDQNNVCQKCDEHYYLKDGKCQECMEHCLECTEHDCGKDPGCVQFECLKCENGYYFSEKDNWKCVYTGILNCESYEYPKDEGQYECFDCQKGYGLSENKTECFKCDDPNCIMCDASPHFCYFCSNETYYENGKCVDKCKDPHCHTCNPYNSADCIYCKDGYGLYLVQADVIGTDEVYYDHHCKPCEVEHCAICDINASTCGFCEPGWRTTDGYTRCERCDDPNCHNCEDMKSICDFCLSGFHLTQDGRCVKCTPENCEDCSDHPDVCFKCAKDYTFDLREGSSTFGKCSKCVIDNCLECDFALTFCVNCSEGYELMAGGCVKVVTSENTGINDGAGDNKTQNPEKKGNKAGLICGVIFGLLGAAAIAVVVVIVVKKKMANNGSEKDQTAQILSFL